MSKRKGIWIAVAVIGVAIVVGIASIPDEVLLDSPSVENTETEDIDIPLPVIDVPIIEEPEETVTEETEPEEITEVIEEPEETAPEETTPDETESDEEGNVIEVSIKDGIGSGDR